MLLDGRQTFIATTPAWRWNVRKTKDAVKFEEALEFSLMPCQKYREMETDWKIMFQNYRYHGNKSHDDRHSNEREKNKEIAERAGREASELNHQMALHRATCPDCKDAIGPPANIDL